MIIVYLVMIVITKKIDFLYLNIYIYNYKKYNVNNH